MVRKNRIINRKRKHLSIKKPNYISSIMKKLLRILSTGITLISFLIFIYLIYRSEFYYSGSLRDYYLTYYIFSFIFIIISILIIFLPDKIKINIFIIFFSLIFSFYSIELFYFFKKTEGLIFKNQTNKIEFYNIYPVSVKPSMYSYEETNTYNKIEISFVFEEFKISTK